MAGGALNTSAPSAAPRPRGRRRRIAGSCGARAAPRAPSARSGPWRSDASWLLSRGHVARAARGRGRGLADARAHPVAILAQDGSGTPKATRSLSWMASPALPSSLHPGGCLQVSLRGAHTGLCRPPLSSASRIISEAGRFARVDSVAPRFLAFLRSLWHGRQRGHSFSRPEPLQED